MEKFIDDIVTVKEFEKNIGISACYTGGTPLVRGSSIRDKIRSYLREILRVIMSARRDDYSGCKVETESASECIQCGKCTRRPSKISTHLIFDKGGDSAGISATQTESNYVSRIVHAGIRNDNVYEVKLLLAPEIDMSSVKITVKNKNLRVKLRRPLGELARRLPLSIHEKSPLNELVKKAVTYYENFLIPESIDGDKVRAIVDNKNRILVLTAPTIKPCKALRRRFSMMLDN